MNVDDRISRLEDAVKSLDRILLWVSIEVLIVVVLGALGFWR